MSETLALSLQAFTSPDVEKESLQYLIQRVNAQKGSFRNVTEQSLEDDIRYGRNENVVDDNEVATDAVPEPREATTKKEELAKAREDILKQTAQAFQETSTALDFISLVLSKSAPAAAQTTMSPFLKQSVPLGSLGAENVQEPQISDAEKHNDEMAGMGRRMKSLNNAADSLLKSASRLEEEVGRETKYWEQVLAVKEKGWFLHRLPREKHTLGVRCGFAESHGDFRDRGLGALRRQEDGSLSIDHGLRWKGDKKLRVRILNQGRPVSTNIGSDTNTTGEESIEKEILYARDSTYDEELHNELDREARSLVNQGVRCIDGSILLPYDNVKQVEITLIPRDEEISRKLEISDPVPHIIAISLSILLSHAHRQNLQRRSGVPPALKESKTSRPVYTLLKPILEYLQHRSRVEATRIFLDRITRTLLSAGLDVSLGQTSSHDLHLLEKSVSDSGGSEVDSLLRMLTSPRHTSWTLAFTSIPIVVTLKIHTAIQPPHFGSTFHISAAHTSQESGTRDLPQVEQFTTTSAFQTHTIHVVTVIIQQILMSECAEWDPVSAHDHSMIRKKAKGQGQDMVFMSLGNDHLGLNWRASPSGESATWNWFGVPAVGQSEESHLLDLFKQI